MKKLIKFVRIPTEDRILLLEAIYFLLYSKIILLFPVKYSIKRLKPVHLMNKDLDRKQLQKISIALTRANKLAFWQNICLVRSFAGRMMLERRGTASVLHFGLQFKNNKELTAHAWLVSGGLEVTPKGNKDFKEIFCV